jgi:hypothetical protein
MCIVNFEVTSFKLSSFKLVRVCIFVELQLAHECHIFVILFIKALSCENYVGSMFKLHKLQHILNMIVDVGGFMCTMDSECGC